MECCGIPMSNFSYLRDALTVKVPHFHCTRCGHRHHDGKDYTSEEWFFFVNEETHQDYRKRIQDQEDTDLMQSVHAHEIINHSNPEGELK